MYRPCNANDCDRIIKGNSIYCSKHRRVAEHHGGDANFQHARLLTLRQRFERKYTVCDATGCWLWTGGKASKNGYGSMAPTAWGTLAHRISYGLFRGDIPPGKCVCHTCDTPSCVNPDHLFVGTIADNVADRDKKGRQVTLRGAKNVNAKLTGELVIEMRQRRVAGEGIVALAKAYGISASTTWSALTGHTWKHIEGKV